MVTYINPTWADVQREADKLAERQKRNGHDSVFGIPSGGAPVALMVAHRLNLEVVHEPGARTLVVDDLVDTGLTLDPYANTYAIDTLYRKPHSPAHIAADATLVDGWVNFPWEHDNGAPTDAVVRLLQHIGEDPKRDGLRDTPKRYVKAIAELTSGYGLDPADILSTTFDVAFDEMVVVRHVPFSSLCEHHVLPFHGHATVAYIPSPGGRVVGLSKLARLVDCYARRLQVQERLTTQIADAIERHLNPLGVGVVITASHTCMSMRGIGKAGQMVTSKLTGILRTEAARAEFMQLANN